MFANTNINLMCFRAREKDQETNRDRAVVQHYFRRYHQRRRRNFPRRRSDSDCTERAVLSGISRVFLLPCYRLSLAYKRARCLGRRDANSTLFPSASELAG